MEICEACGCSYQLPSNVQHTYRGGLCLTCLKQDIYQEALAQSRDDYDEDGRYAGLAWCPMCGGHEEHHDPERCLEIQDQRCHDRWVQGLRRGFDNGATEFRSQTGHLWQRSQRRPHEVFSTDGEDPCHVLCLICGQDWVGDPGWHTCPLNIPMVEVVVDAQHFAPSEIRMASWEWR